MAVIHIFNPEHDIALASNLSNFTAPHAARQLRHDLGYLPALWAEDGDCVLVDNVAKAERDFMRLVHRPFGRFIDQSMLCTLNESFRRVVPWGWDRALRAYLLRWGFQSVPTEQKLTTVRRLSHRCKAASLLAELQTEGTTGQAWVGGSPTFVRNVLAEQRRIVVKAPWSSSGRGIRFVDDSLPESVERWLKNVIKAQRNIVVERYCDKVKDFGMEFESDGRGRVTYLGLSLFSTRNGAYTGSILAPEEEKREMIGRYIDLELLDTVRDRICQRLGELYNHRYAGPFGIDMMVVRGDGRHPFLLNPCVEINVRRTMGHVALALARECPAGSVMRVEFIDHTYKLKIQQ